MVSTTRSPGPPDQQAQTALVVEVPAAEAAVGRWRARFDRAARAGVPAHVTVCFPFLAPEDVDEAALADLVDLAAGVAPFETTFASTATFGDAVLWLAPDPADPFRDLLRAVHERFGVLPYGGVHGGVDDAVPHLTVAEQPQHLDDVLDGVRADVERHLPLTQRVSALTLPQGTFTGHGWRVRRRFALGPAGRRPQSSGAGAAGPV